MYHLKSTIESVFFLDTVYEVHYVIVDEVRQVVATAVLLVPRSDYVGLPQTAGC